MYVEHKAVIVLTVIACMCSCTLIFVKGDSNTIDQHNAHTVDLSDDELEPTTLELLERLKGRERYRDKKTNDTNGK
jgi:hypothetical protein